MLVIDKLIKSQSRVHESIIENLSNAKKAVKVYLRNGICLEGLIEQYDQTILILKDENQQMIYK